MSEQVTGEAPVSTDDEAGELFRIDGLLPSEAVVHAVATVTGTDPTELEPLYATVDPDALDTIVETDGDEEEPIAHPTTVSFALEGHHVTVRADGFVHVREL
jgi:hypothetical protein